MHATACLGKYLCVPVAQLHKCAQACTYGCMYACVCEHLSMPVSLGVFVAAGVRAHGWRLRLRVATGRLRRIRRAAPVKWRHS